MKMSSNRRQALVATLLGALSLACPWHAQAQSTYPDKPVRFVVPYPPGGGTDVIARIVQNRLSAALGQNILIDNKGGAGARWAPNWWPRRHLTAIPCCSR